MKTLKNILAIVTLLITFNSYSQIIDISYKKCNGPFPLVPIDTIITPYEPSVNNINEINIDCDNIKFVNNQYTGNYSVFICNNFDWGNIDYTNDKFNQIINVSDSVYIIVYKNNIGYKVKVTNNSPTASVDENKMNVSELIAYPNPAVNQITVKFETNKTNIPISVYSLTGALVYRNEDNRDFGRNEHSINTEHLKPGLYLLTVGSSTQKITLE